jgi:hypothetical protein
MKIYINRGHTNFAPHRYPEHYTLIICLADNIEEAKEQFERIHKLYDRENEINITEHDVNTRGIMHIDMCDD